MIPNEYQDEVERDLSRFGERLVGDILEFAEDAESNPPVHIPYSSWGKRIDTIKTSRGWNELDKVSAEEGIVASGYERKFGSSSRAYQFAKLYLYHPSSAFYTCPLAMTDGAARLIESIGDTELKEKALQNIISRDPKKFWTSGQWMTERTGGSDVGLSETIAKVDGDAYRLYGTKWFTSATTSQMAMTLAKIEGDEKLSLFYVELRDENNSLQNIQVNRLKDKLGTKALPTAELDLKGTPAKLVGEREAGIKNIAILFNVTRIYNATTTVGALRRLLDLAKDFSNKRIAFKKKINEHPLHIRTLADAEVDCQAMFHLTMFTADLLGKEECGTEDEKNYAAPLLRLFTPIAKLWTAKIGMRHTSELIESFGGAGYIEDTGLPKWLRDNQVFSIWEGTTNVLSLDVLRAMTKDGSYPNAARELTKRLNSVSGLENEKEHVSNSIQMLNQFMEGLAGDDRLDQESAARTFAMSLGNITAAVLLLEHASETKDQVFELVAKRFCERNLCEVGNLTALELSDEQKILN